MEKRKAEMTPLKKIAYLAEEEEEDSLWWNKEMSSLITQKKIDSIHIQMTEYKALAEVANQEKERLLNLKVQELLENQPEDICEKVSVLLLRTQEQAHLVSQLRKRLHKLKLKIHSEPLEKPAQNEPIDPAPQKEEREKSISPEIQLPEIDIQQYIDKIDALENRIEAALSKHFPNNQSLVKMLETENTELSATVNSLTQRVKEEIEKILLLEQDILELNRTIKQLQDQSNAQTENLEKATSAFAEERTILQNRIAELYLTIEKINSDMIDYSQDLEKENTPNDSCTEKCALRMKELENKEIDRVEEISFLVRRYIDTSKKNDELLLEVHSLKQALPTAPTPPKESPKGTSELEKLTIEKNHLEAELKKSKLEYLERNSSAQHHKRKSIQFESEAQAFRKTAIDMEQANSHLQAKIEQLKETYAQQQKKKSPTNDLELYQKMVRCSVCCANIKNTILKKCMHLMCKECVEARYAARQKTCPLCGAIFSMNDVSHIYL
ncbi:hypothetical protein NEOKW01_0413 [Nematocida sp. AWRm80]|nr:hypothetical protein NEOKW01_0413 [Nematocida sp. AWRm80]